MPWVTSDSQDSPQLRLGGNDHLPPYSILCASPRSATKQRGSEPHATTPLYSILCGSLRRHDELSIAWMCIKGAHDFLNPMHLLLVLSLVLLNGKDGNLLKI
jgi:hypothetical protein